MDPGAVRETHGSKDYHRAQTSGKEAGTSQEHPYTVRLGVLMCLGYKLRLTQDTQVTPYLGPVMASGPIILGKVLLSATTFDALNSHDLLFSGDWSEL